MSELDVIKRWPRYENGEFVNFGDELPDFARTIYKTVRTVQFNDNGVVTISNNGGSANINVFLRPGERLKRPAHNVFDANGVKCKKGQMVWLLDLPKHPWFIENIMADDTLILVRKIGSNDFIKAQPNEVTRRAPLPDDSWEKWVKDSKFSPCEYADKYHLGRIGYREADMNKDLVRRAKTLMNRR